MTTETYFTFVGPALLLVACAMVGIVGRFFTGPWFGSGK
jgi:hypothetical protein